MFKFKKKNNNKVIGRQRAYSSRQLENRRYLYHSVSLEQAKQQSTNIKFKKDETDINHITEINITKFWIRRIVELFIWSVIIVAGIRLLSLSTVAQVKVLNNNTQFNSMIYQKIIDQQLASSWFNHNKLTVNVNNIAKVLESKYPTIVSVKANVPLVGNSLNIDITTSSPRLFLSTTYNAGLVDGQGRVVSIDNINKASSGLIIVNYPISVKLAIGDNILTPSIVNFINDVTYELKLKKITVNYFEVLPGANELDAYITNTKYYVKFDLQSNNPLLQIGTYLAVIHNLSLHNQSPSQYIDVRIPGRAYYK